MCVICDKEYHGQCNGREQCVNCGKKHKSSDRNGEKRLIRNIREKYQKKLVMNQIKATKGITSYGARTIIDSATEKKRRGERIKYKKRNRKHRD